MASLEHYIQKISEHEPKHPSHVPKGQIFPATRSAPQLDRTQTNRVIIYYGSFNPPHRGHLRLLRHTFYHGAHGLNMVGAIIRPLRDQHVIEKCKKAGGSFVFGRDERSMLWKQDLCFPDWAWVYEANKGTLKAFLNRLKEAASEDGFIIEFVPLRGPYEDDHTSPPDEDDFSHGASTLIISDAARLANYQRSCGYMRNFVSYTKWRQVQMEEENLKSSVRQKMQRTLEDRSTIHPQEASSMLESGPTFVEEATEKALESILSDMRNILHCQRQMNGKKYTIRFVKANRSCCQEWKNYTSSSELREAMSNPRSKLMKTALDEMALSADVLWRCRSQWSEKALAKRSELITFDPCITRVADDVPQVMDQKWWDYQKEKTNGVERIQEESNKQEDIQTSQEGEALVSQEQTRKRKRKRSLSVIVNPATSEKSTMTRSNGGKKRRKQAEDQKEVKIASPIAKDGEGKDEEHTVSHDKPPQNGWEQSLDDKQPQQENEAIPALETYDAPSQEHAS